MLVGYRWLAPLLSWSMLPSCCTEFLADVTEWTWAKAPPLPAPLRHSLSRPKLATVPWQRGYIKLGQAQQLGTLG